MPSAIVPAALGFAGGSLFGGGGGGQETQVVQQPTTTTAQQNLIGRIAQFLTPQIGQQPRVPGQDLGPVGASGLQQQAFGLGQRLPGQQAFDPGATSQAFEPIAQAARTGFQEETIPSILGALGFGGSARASGAANILGREGRRLEQGLAAQFAPLQFQAQQQAFNRQSQLPSQLFNLGAGQRGIAGEQQAFNLQRFQQQDPLRNPALELGLRTGGLQSFQQPGIIPGTPGTLQQLLPIAGQLGGAFLGTQQGAGALAGLF